MIQQNTPHTTKYTAIHYKHTANNKTHCDTTKDTAYNKTRCDITLENLFANVISKCN